jgi:Cd2+/Zn2+-exporting ATPase
VERFARYYTPLMIALAAAVVLLPPLLAGGHWSTWFYRGLVLLVIACPCALVISTPVSIVSGLTCAMRNGVLIKGGAFLEAVGRLKAIALDKTGTVTTGRPEVQQIVPFDGHTGAELLALAAAIEADSVHPLAEAVLRKATAEGVEVRRADSFQLLSGWGAEATVDGRPYWIGSHRLMDERGQETGQIHEMALALEDAGHSVVAIGSDDHVCGLLSFADGVRPGAGRTVQEIKQLGVRRIVMLTGDNEPTARAVAEATGIEEFRAELLPAEKVEVVQSLVSTVGHTAMVGDGVNDAPAMASAHIGIAMGAIGSDAAIETADITLMSDDLPRLPWLIRHSRRTLSIIRQNVVLALGIKAAFILLALAGLATLWMAIAADMGASLLVIFNGLRLLRYLPAAA